MILVTGAHGFVGRAMVARLRRDGFAVRAAIRADRGPRCEGVAYAIADLEHDDGAWNAALQGIQTVIHLAARVHVMRETAPDPLAAFRRTNVIGTLALARRAARLGARRFIYVSSIKVNGESGLCLETNPPAPEDAYGISKYEAETGLGSLSADTGLETVIIRPPLVYGPGVGGNFGALIRAVARGIPLPLGATRNQRSLIAVDNLVDVLVRCIDHPHAANEIFLVSDGHDVSTGALIEALARAMGRPARLIPVPPSLLQAAATLIGRGDMARRLLGSLQIDMSKARHRLDWVPPIDLDDALQRAVPDILVPIPIPATIGALLIIVFTSSAWLTGRLRRYALARHILDHPNERSSHSVPTPRGGGMAIVVTTVIGLVVVGWRDGLSMPLLWGTIASGAFVAAIGFADDHGHVPRRARLLAHIAAAAVLLWCAGGTPVVAADGTVMVPGWLVYLVAGLYVVWLINLTNFMDGIDGMAGVEALTVSLGGVALYAVVAPHADQLAPPAIFAAATLGFLVWNWPPAKIFMGDGGSGFTGLMFAALSLQAARVDPALFWSWLILLGVFIVDTTVTLLRRMIRGERIYDAHRTHAYQRAARRYGAHLPVTIAVGVVNIVWLLPIAALVGGHLVDARLGVPIAYGPLIGLAFWLGAGSRETPETP